MPDPTAAAPRFLDRLDRLHARVRERAVLYRFTLATRILLAAGFIPTGMVKLLGRRFTAMDPASDIGAFFEAMYRSGPYWRFIGATQVAAGILMLIPRTALLGALAFAPVIASIFVITLSYDFHGTPLVTGMMLLATLYLLCWDWHRVRPLFSDAPRAPLVLAEHRLTVAERGIYTGGAAAGFLAFFAMRGFAPPGIMAWSLGVAALAALAGVLAWAVPAVALASGGKKRAF